MHKRGLLRETKVADTGKGLISSENLGKIWRILFQSLTPKQRPGFQFMQE